MNAMNRGEVEAAVAAAREKGERPVLTGADLSELLEVSNHGCCWGGSRCRVGRCVFSCVVCPSPVGRTSPLLFGIF